MFSATAAFPDMLADDLRLAAEQTPKRRRISDRRCAEAEDGPLNAIREPTVAPYQGRLKARHLHLRDPGALGQVAMHATRVKTLFWSMLHGVMARTGATLLQPISHAKDSDAEEVWLMCAAQNNGQVLERRTGIIPTTLSCGNPECTGRSSIWGLLLTIPSEKAGGWCFD